MASEDKPQDKSDNAEDQSGLERTGNTADTPSRIILPTDELDELGRLMLKIEFNNPTIRLVDLVDAVAACGRRYDRKAIMRRRGAPVYQRQLVELRKNSMEVLADAELEAVRVLKRTLQSTDEASRIKAATTLVKGALEYRRVAVSRRAEQENEHGRQVEVIQFELPPGFKVLGDKPEVVDEDSDEGVDAKDVDK